MTGCAEVPRDVETVPDAAHDAAVLCQSRQSMRFARTHQAAIKAGDEPLMVISAEDFGPGFEI